MAGTCCCKSSIEAQVFRYTMASSLGDVKKLKVQVSQFPPSFWLFDSSLTYYTSCSP